MVGKTSVLLFEARPSKHRPSKHRARTFMFRGGMLRKQRATLHLECSGMHVPHSYGPDFVHGPCLQVLVQLPKP